MLQIRTAFLAGAALAAAGGSTRADELSALRAQIDALNARLAPLEAATPIADHDELITLSEGALPQTPGLGMDARELASYGIKGTIITVLPMAADAAGATISWSGNVRAGLVHAAARREVTSGSTLPLINEADELDVLSRGELRLTAATETDVGEVGADIRLRGDFNGTGEADLYADVAWGYWAMTPELTLGGGYAGSLGNIGYGYDGGCSCYYTDNAGVAFDPGDVTQLRLSHVSGPLSLAIALEDGSAEDDTLNGDTLGLAGEIAYAGSVISAEVSAVWREVDGGAYTVDFQESRGIPADAGIGAMWQAGAGLGLALGGRASLSLAAAIGETPGRYAILSDSFPYLGRWWGVSALMRVNLGEAVYAELAGGYRKQTAGDVTFTVVDDLTVSDFESDTRAILGGLYYQPVDQLTLGIEAEWFETHTQFVFPLLPPVLDDWSETSSLNLVTVWRF